MLTLASDIDTHLDGEVTTLVTCWKVTLPNHSNLVLGFTDHDADIPVGGVTYRAQSGYAASDIVQTSGFAIDSQEIEGVIDGNEINREDILAGRWDGAVIERFMVNYKNPAGGTIPLTGVELGAFQVADQTLFAEALGVKNKLSQAVGRIVQPNCEYNVGEARCGVNLASYTHSCTVTNVDDGQTFYDTVVNQADDYFGEGTVLWLTGENAGLRMEIRDYENDAAQGKFILVQSMPFAIQIGDTFTATAGCRRATDPCKNKFNNLVNYGGQPFVPGLRRFLSGP